MADHLASIYGTEKDKVNCSFYFKIGACRHGEKCSRKHVKPTFSQTLLLPNLFSPTDDDEHFEDFFEDIFIELAKYGEVEEVNVCDNVGDHLVGNVYARFRYEEDAQKAVDGLNDRFYGGKPVWAELSPVTDFREACCRQYEIGECNRGGLCNFMHLRPVSRSLKRDLFESQRAYLRNLRKEKEREEREKGGEGENSSSSRRKRREGSVSVREGEESVRSRSRSGSRSARRGSERRERDRDRSRDRERRREREPRDRDGRRDGRHYSEHDIHGHGHGHGHEHGLGHVHGHGHPPPPPHPHPLPEQGGAYDPNAPPAYPASLAHYYT